jgi:hypothetical protein
MVDFVNGKKVSAEAGGENVNKEVAKDYPYMNVLYQGESIGIVEIPD